MLLWKLRGTSLLPSLAVVTIILSTILDLFGQQLITFYQCSNLDVTDRNATIQRAHFFNSKLRSRKIVSSFNLGVQLESSIMQGLYQAQPLSAPFNYSTGTCRFPKRYGNAAWCSRCTDLSEKVVGSAKMGYALFGMTVLDGGELRLNTLKDGDTDNITGQALFSRKGKDTSEQANTWGARGYGAAECEVFPCLQAYLATVELSELVEHLDAEDYI